MTAIALPKHGRLGHYLPLLPLGSGGMADVILASLDGPGGFQKLVVLKCLKRHLAGDPQLRETFLTEARLTARMNHPNVVQVLEILDVGEASVMAMEYLEGESLATVLAAAPIELPRSLHLYVLSEMLRGLHYFHELQSLDGTPLSPVHRDVSPHNVFVTQEGVVKVLDFGIARALEPTDRINTETGIVKGKIHYMAPEQLAGQPLDRRADVFAAGIMLWEALCHRRLWKDMTEMDVMRALLNGGWPSARELAPGLPVELYEAVEGALCLDVRQRLPTAQALRDLLVRGLSQTGSADGEALGLYMQRSFGEHHSAQRRLVAKRLERPPSEWSIPPLVVGDCDAARLAPTVKVGSHSQEAGLEADAPEDKNSTRHARSAAAPFVWLAALGTVALLASISWWVVSTRSSAREAANPVGSGAPVSPTHVARVPALPVVNTPSVVGDSGTPCSDPELLDDFEDGDGWLCHFQSRRGQWVLYFDGTGELTPLPGPISHAAELPQPRGASHRALSVVGSGLRDFGAGLAVQLAGGDDYDVSKWSGITAWLRSPVPLEVSLALGTRSTMSAAYGGRCEPKGNLGCDDHYEVTRVIGPHWTYVRAPLSELHQRGGGQVAPWNPKEVVELHVRIHHLPSEPPMSFSLIVDDVGFW